MCSRSNWMGWTESETTLTDTYKKQSQTWFLVALANTGACKPVDDNVAKLRPSLGAYQVPFVLCTYVAIQKENNRKPGCFFFFCLKIDQNMRLTCLCFASKMEQMAKDTRPENREEWYLAYAWMLVVYKYLSTIILRLSCGHWSTLFFNKNALLCLAWERPKGTVGREHHSQIKIQGTSPFL